jgi:hypothetical protein
MTPSLGIVNKRQILYLSQAQYPDLSALLPDSNWMLFAIADREQVPLLDALAKTCLEKGVLYICGAGDSGSQIDDAFDIEIVNRKIAANNDDYDDTLMTTWHNNLEEGFWFATTVAYHDTIPIDTVVSLNLTEHDYQDRISDLINKINSGWIPED